MGIAQFVPTKISEQQDVDLTGLAAGNVLSWDGSHFVPGSAGATSFAGLSGTATFAQIPSRIYDVKTYGAVGDGTTDDTTAIAAALAAIPAGGGNLYFPAGNYKITSGFTLSKTIRVIGDAAGSGAANDITVISFNTTTGIAFTVSADFCEFTQLSIVNPNASPGTANRGILDNGNNTHYTRMTVDGFYIDVDHQNGTACQWRGTTLSNAVLYPLRITNTSSPDGGDHVISDCLFLTNTHQATSAIRLQDVSGIKVANIKVNSGVTGFTNGIDFAATNGNACADLAVSNSSIEGWGFAGHGISVTTAGTGTISNITVIGGNISSLEAPNTGAAVYLNAASVGNIAQVTVVGVVAFSSPANTASAFSFTNVSNLAFDDCVQEGFAQLSTTTTCTSYIKTITQDAPVSDGTLGYVEALYDIRSFAAGRGGGLSFGGTYNSAGDTAGFGGIQVYKENGTDGNYATALGLFTRANGGNVTEQFHIGSNGRATVSNGSDANVELGTTAVGAGDKYGIVGPSVNVPLVLQTGGTERLRVNTDGSLTFSNASGTRTALGVGTGDTPTFAGISLGGTLSLSSTASTTRTNLGLAIGSDVQAHSANLDTVAAVSVNSFGAGFLAESTALQMRTYFGLDYLYSGTGSPEGAVTAPVGSRYNRTNGGAGTCLYVKESGVGNTGWVAYASGQGAVPAGGTIAYVLTKNSGTDFDYSWAAVPGSGGGGTVTSVSVVTANGISGTVATATSTPAITLALGAITPTTVVASGNISGANLSGTNTGDQTITLTGDVTGTGTGSFGATIAANAVTLAKFQQIATASILGRNTAATGNIEVLSATTVKSLLGLVIGTNVQAWDADLDAFALKTAPTGAVVGDTDTQTIANKTLTAPIINGATAASGNLDFSGSTGTFKTSTGANTLGGAVTISAATPSLTTASGQTNTGFVLVQGKTSGGLKLLPVDAAGQTVTVSLAAQTVGVSTLTIPDFANVSDTFAFIGLAQTLTNKTLTSPKINENVALTTTATKLNFLTSATGTTGTASTNIVFSTSPTLVTPTLGAATATSVNKWAFTAPSTAATLTAGADNLTYTLPDITCNIGFREIPQNSKSANYTTVLTDNGKHIYHPSADTTARTFTIDSNVNVAYPVGAAIVFINDSSAGVLTIAISSDTLVQAGTGSTGSRTLAANGRAMAIKVAATRWQIDGNGLT